jgi:hypothetical protein
MDDDFKSDQLFIDPLISTLTSTCQRKMIPQGNTRAWNTSYLPFDGILTLSDHKHGSPYLEPSHVRFVLWDS